MNACSPQRRARRSLPPRRRPLHRRGRRVRRDGWDGNMTWTWTWDGMGWRPLHRRGRRVRRDGWDGMGGMGTWDGMGWRPLHRRGRRVGVHVVHVGSAHPALPQRRSHCPGRSGDSQTVRRRPGGGQAAVRLWPGGGQAAARRRPRLGRVCGGPRTPERAVAVGWRRRGVVCVAGRAHRSQLRQRRRPARRRVRRRLQHEHASPLAHHLWRPSCAHARGCHTATRGCHTAAARAVPNGV